MEKDIHFPLAGIDVGGAFSKQPARKIGSGQSDYARTTPVAINVCSYPEGGRKRGGSRAGLSRFINAKVNGNWIVQMLSVLVTANADAQDGGA